jgi:hypothetical protein
MASARIEMQYPHRVLNLLLRCPYTWARFLALGAYGKGCEGVMDSLGRYHARTGDND